MARKAQAAMEFLMTYGWAIMIALTVIGALSYFGVFDIQKTLPDKCELGPGLECVDYHMDENGATMVVQNTLGREIQITELSFARRGEDTAFCVSLPGDEVVVAAGDTTTIKCRGDLDIRGKERFEPTVKFKLNDEMFEITGDLFTAPEEVEEEEPFMEKELFNQPPASEPDPSKPEEAPPDEEVSPVNEEVPITNEPLEPVNEEVPFNPNEFVPEGPVEEKAATEYICDNKIDDDSDDYIDCQDPDCADDKACTATEILCADDIDNDKDGLIDCSDVDCKGTEVCPNPNG